MELNQNIEAFKESIRKDPGIADYLRQVLAESLAAANTSMMMKTKKFEVDLSDQLLTDKISTTFFNKILCKQETTYKVLEIKREYNCQCSNCHDKFKFTGSTFEKLPDVIQCSSCELKMIPKTAN
jgi:hypothetical protein